MTETDRHYISFLIGNHVWLRRTDISFHSSYWKPRMTETDRQHFISFLILETTHDRRTDISFHFSYWKPRTTDGQTFHFIPHIGNHVRQTDRHYISFLISETTYDRRRHFISHIGNHVWQTDRQHFISILILETKLVSDIVTAGLGIKPLTFCSAGQELNHYPTASPSAHIGIQVRQTEGQTTVSFHPSYWIFTPSEKFSIYSTTDSANCI